MPIRFIGRLADTSLSGSALNFRGQVAASFWFAM
jgi:hypothetical protein